MKRRIIAFATFLAGLYYVLEFLVPPHIGGALDAAGAFGGSVDSVNGRFVLLYTGIRQDGPPRILRAAYPAADGTAATALAPSPFRAADYYGAMNPQVIGSRLYYIGLGWDDRLPRVCMAVWRDGHWEPMGSLGLKRGPAGSWDASGVTWVSLLPPARDHLWRMWYIGRQADVGRVEFATSPDGIHWTKVAAPVVHPPDGSSIESVSVARWSGRMWAVFVLKDLGTGAARLGWAWMNSDTGLPARTIADLPLRKTPYGPSWQTLVPKGVHDTRIVSYADNRASSPRLLLSIRGNEGRMFLAEAAAVTSFEGDRVPGFQLEPRAVKMPGPRPISTGLSNVRNSVDDLIVVISAFAVGVGLVSLAQVHGRRIRRKAPGWPESCAFFMAAGSMTFFTLYSRLHPHAERWIASGYNLLFFGLLQPLGSSMFALLAAYLVSAAYRAFRIRNLEASLMALAAVLVMLGQVPVGHLMTRSLPDALQIPTLMAWVLYVANNAVVRAINFGVFVGAIATALRIWLSMDRGFDVAPP